MVYFPVLPLSFHMDIYSITNDFKQPSASPFCHGASVSDITAIGPEQESIASWRQRCGIKTENQIRLVKLVHMRYQHPDLDQITVFLQGTYDLRPPSATTED